MTELSVEGAESILRNMWDDWLIRQRHLDASRVLRDRLHELEDLNEDLKEQLEKERAGRGRGREVRELRARAAGAETALAEARRLHAEDLEKLDAILLHCKQIEAIIEAHAEELEGRAAIIPFERTTNGE